MKVFCFCWDNINRLAAIIGILLAYSIIALFIYVQYAATWYINPPQSGILCLTSETHTFFKPIFQVCANLILFSTWSDIARRQIVHDLNWREIINRFFLLWQCLLPALLLIAIFKWIGYLYKGIKTNVEYGDLFIKTLYPFIWNFVIGIAVITAIHFWNKRKQSNSSTK